MSEEPRVARGNRRWGRILLVCGLLLIVLLVVVDRVGLIIAERELGNQARKQLSSEDIATTGNPSVSIAGFPFLTQVLSGHYDKINIVVHDPTSHGVHLDSLNVTATGVNAPTNTVMSGNGQIEAAKVVGTGQISWAAFTEMVDLGGLKQYGVNPSSIQISGTDNGEIDLAIPISVGGQSFTALASGTVSVTHDLVHVKVTKIASSGGTVPVVATAALSAIQAQLTFDARIPALPYRLVLESVRATSNGISIGASATDVVLGS
jgi:hypothetical protein